jgi:hypothetical protein
LYAAAEKAATRVRYDNISLQVVENPPPTYTIQTTNMISSEPISIISHQQESPTKNTAVIKVPNQSQLLVFQQSYHPGWRAYVVKAGASPNWWRKWFLGEPGYRIDETNHTMVNGYANGWWIDAAQFPEEYRTANGEYEIVLEYWPQRWLHTGGLISGTTFGAGAGIVAYSWQRNRRQQMAHYSARNRELS